jgi:hypothetical protein
MRSLLYVFFFLCLLWSPSVLSQDGNFLDLTKIRQSAVSKMTGRGEGGGAVVGHIRKPRSNPFKLTLLNLHKQSYQTGEEVVYDILLENMTNDSIVIPWSPDQNKVKPDENKTPPGYVEAFLSLITTDEVSGDQFIAGQGLYGSELAPGSLKKLGPKQSVRIRAPGQLSFFNADVARRVLATLPRKIEMRARYSLQERGFDSQFEPSTSINTVVIEVKKRQE